MTNVSAPGLIITKEIIALTRKTIFENLGHKKAVNFLFRFGKELGEQKVKELINVHNITHVDEIIKYIVNFHIEIGHISKLTRFGTIRKTEEGPQFFNSTGIWHDSFEVDEHLKHFGKSDYTVCQIISGFMSGASSIIFEEEIFVKEITCKAKGDNECAFEINTKKYWEDIGESLDIYDTNTYITELEYTYDKLIEKTNLLDQMIHFHSSITDTVAQQNDIKQLLLTAFSILNYPIVILNINGEIMFNEGLEEEIPEKIWLTIIKNITKTTSSTYRKHKFLITPIYLEKKIFAYGCFIYPELTDISNNDSVYLERLSVATSLCFLNEKASFEATERFKINFLDRLISNHFKNEDEIIIHANYIEPKIHPPFITWSIKIELDQSPSVNIHSLTLNLAKELKKQQLNGLITQKGTHIIVFLYEINQTNYIEIIQKILENVLKSISFKVGISKNFKKLKDFHLALQQSERALKFPTKDKYIFYERLGIYSELLENIDPEHLYMVARKELGSLLDSNEKSKILLHTLYVYLKNNQKLEVTMVELSLSIGGIKYRLKKIEEIIGKNLKDASTFAFIYILIEALLISNTISFR